MHQSHSTEKQGHISLEQTGMLNNHRRTCIMQNDLTNQTLSTHKRALLYIYVCVHLTENKYDRFA